MQSMRAGRQQSVGSRTGYWAGIALGNIIHGQSAISGTREGLNVTCKSVSDGYDMLNARTTRSGFSEGDFGMTAQFANFQKRKDSPPAGIQNNRCRRSPVEPRQALSPGQERQHDRRASSGRPAAIGAAGQSS